MTILYSTDPKPAQRGYNDNCCNYGRGFHQQSLATLQPEVTGFQLTDTLGAGSPLITGRIQRRFQFMDPLDRDPPLLRRPGSMGLCLLGALNGLTQ